MSHVPKRRWLKLSLWALAAVVLVSIAWFDSRSKWIWERNQKRTWISSHAGFIEDELSTPPAPMQAPWSLRICGETGVSSIILDEKKMINGLRSDPDRDVNLMAKKLRRLFPEAEIRIRDAQGRETTVSATIDPPQI